MLLSITTTHRPASDLGYLLHKHPDKFQSFDLSFGAAHAYYPEVGDDRCTACLLLDVDAVGLVRGRNPDQDFLLAQYVNDRPYVASSFLSVAIAQVFGSALQGRCKDRPELVTTPLPLEARLDVLPVRGGEGFLRAVFEPLGYEVEAARHPLDEKFPEWGESPYFSVTVRRTATLSELLTHLYVLVPVFDARKHYYVGHDEMEKLLAKGEGWLARHPAKDEIARRFLGNRPSLYRLALSRLVGDEEPEEDETPEKERAEERLEKPISLNDQRLGSVVAALRASGARRALDLGCGEGKLIRELLKDRQLEEILGMDVSVRSLEIANRRLKLERLPEVQAKRVKLIHGSLMYRDKRLDGFDAACVVEVVEHLDPWTMCVWSSRALAPSLLPLGHGPSRGEARNSVMWRSMLRVAAATAAFGLVHSALASRTAKRVAAWTFGERNRNGLYRVFYIGQSLVTFGILAAYIRRQPSRELYRVEGPLAFLLHAVQAGAVVYATAAAGQVGLRRITGLESFLAWLGDGPVSPEPEAQGPALDGEGQDHAAGPFAWSRHPLNFAPLPIFWLMPRMTTNLLAFNTAATIYLVVGSLHEEARLRDAFGDDYDAYLDSGVPFYVPAPELSVLEATDSVANPEGVPQ